jgi:hypothetical protein
MVAFGGNGRPIAEELTGADPSRAADSDSEIRYCRPEAGQWFSRAGQFRSSVFLEDEKAN